MLRISSSYYTLSIAVPNQSTVKCLSRIGTIASIDLAYFQLPMEFLHTASHESQHATKEKVLPQAATSRISNFSSDSWKIRLKIIIHVFVSPHSLAHVLSFARAIVFELQPTVCIYEHSMRHRLPLGGPKKKSVCSMSSSHIPSRVETLA